MACSYLIFKQGKIYAADFEIEVHSLHWGEIHIVNMNAMNTFKLAFLFILGRCGRCF